MLKLLLILALVAFVTISAKDSKHKPPKKASGDCNAKKCKANETYVECPDFNCEPRTCDDVGFPQTCTIQKEGEACPGKPACLCITGYVRNDCGVCVPKEDCPSCGGDPNAVAGCGTNCNRHCYNYNKKPGACALFCLENGCECKPDFVYDDNIKKCVDPDDCTPQCTGSNEEYDPCPPTCPPQTCVSLGEQYNCPFESADKPNCQGACRCISGYYRNALQECVSEEECKKCPGENEYYDTCPPYCSPQTCDSIGKKLFCPAHTEVCQPACRCIKDYYRDSKNKCIPEKDCCKSTPTKPPVKKPTKKPPVHCDDDDEDEDDK